jgi:hypothetical protein
MAHNPTNAQLAVGRLKLQEQEKVVNNLETRIADAQRALELVIEESKLAISLLEKEKNMAAEDVKATKEFLSPMRRLPDDLMRHIFQANFEDVPCCAWRLTAVCVSWRRIALNMPKLWSKVRNFLSMLQTNLIIMSLLALLLDSCCHYS